MLVILDKIKRAVLKLYNRSSSKAFVSFLRKKGVVIGDRVVFRDPWNTSIDLTRPCLIEIGSDVDINENFSIMTHDFTSFVFKNLYQDFVASSGGVKLGNNIYIARNVTILKGVTIGNNCIIGAGSIITKTIPDNSVACGVPCRVISSIEDYYNKRKEAELQEALLYGVRIIERYHRDPVVEDFTEEWTVFADRQMAQENPFIKGQINKRFSNPDVFLSDRKPVVTGWNSFLAQIKITYNKIHSGDE